MKELRVLSPTAILGYGFPESSFEEGMKLKPHVIAVDAGSTDPGPYYLGSGKSFTDRNAVKRDLEFMIPAGIENKIPVIIGTAGGSGAKPHLDWCLEIIKEIAKEKNLVFKLAVIDTEISKELVSQKFKENKIIPLSAVPEITAQDIDSSTHIVAQIGHEPIVEALDKGADVIVTGRAYDPVVFASLCIKEGFDKGLAIHMGKILECAAIATVPGSGSDCMFGVLRKDSFILHTLSSVRKCSTLSVAAHTLYEKSDPVHLPGPGGVLDLSNTSFSQVDDKTVEVRGSKYVETDNGKYYVKLEAAKRLGYRTVSIGACKDSIMISKIDSIIDEVHKKVASNFNNYGISDYFLDFKIYGKNGVMGMFPDIPTDVSSELCIVIEAVAQTKEHSNTVCSFARSTLLHYGYEGRIATAGNLAFPFSPSDFDAGDVYEFSIYHLMEVDSPTAHFPVKIYNCDKGEIK